MKKLLTILTLLMAVITQASADEKNVWEGSEQISWNTEVAPGTQFETPEGTFTGLKKDDIIRVYTTTTYDEPQYVLTYKKGDSWEWTDLETSFSEGVISYTVSDETTATEIAERGLIVRGQAYTITKITVDDGQDESDTFTPEENETVLTVAEGSSALPLALLNDWSAYTTFSTASFTSAKAGDIITVYVSNVAEGAQISLKEMSGDWPALEDATAYPSVATTATTYTYTLTETTVAKVKSNGLVVGGHDLTVVRVTLTSVSSSTTQFTLTVTQPTGETGTIKIGDVAATTKAYDENTVLELTANPISNYQFDNWVSETEGVVTDANKSTSPLSITMNKDIDISATFSVVNAKILDWKHEYVSNNDYDLSAAAVGDKVRITFAKTSDEGGDMYLKVSAKSDSWAYDPTFYDATITETTYDIEVTAGNQTNITTRGLYLQGSNITIQNIEVVSAKTVQMLKQASKVMRGETYNTVITIAASSFTNASAGDVITVNMSAVAESGAVITLKENGGSYGQLTTNYSESLTSGQTAYTLTITSDILTRLKSNGLFITGNGFTCGNISLTSAGAITEDTSANPAEKYTLTITAPENGSITVKDGDTELDNGNIVQEGTTLTLSATANGGYAFSKWQKDGADMEDANNPTTIDMPSANMSVTAVFASTDTRTEKTLVSGSVVCGSDETATTTIPGYKFKNAVAGDELVVHVSAVSDGATIVPKNPSTYGSYFGDAYQASIATEATEYRLALTSDMITTLKTAGLQVYGKNLTIGDIGLYTDSDLGTEDPISNYTLTKTVTPTGCGSITVKNGDTETTDTEFAANTQLTLTSTAENGYQFKQWQNGDETLTDNPLTLTMDASKTITAIFEAKTTALAELESRTLWEDLDGAVLSWNNICEKSSDWGAILEKNEEIQVTVSAKDAATEWPKVVLRDASSEEITNTLLNDVSEFPYVVKFTLTTDFLTKMANGFKISGDGVTVTKVVLYKPAAVLPVFDENGKMDLSKFNSDGTAGYSYADGKGMITTGEGQTYKGVVVNLGSDDYVSGTKMIFKFQSETAAQIHVNYVGEEWADGAQVSTTGSTITVPLDATKQVNRIDIQLWNEKTTAVLTEVSINNKCTLTVSATNGTVAVKNGETTTTATEFDYGTSLTLTATPTSSDYSFKQWVIGETTKTDNPYTFTITGDTEISAEFKSADADVIWLGSQEINWNNSKSQTVIVTTDDNLKIADCLVFTITPNVEGIEWPQLQLSSKSDGNPVLIGTANTAIDANTTEVRYCVTKAMLNDITTNGGFIVSGAVFTLNKVKIERGNGGEGYENAIWIGENEYPSNWSVYTTIGKDLFANATAGQVIRMKYKDVKTAANMSFSYDDNGWKDLPDAPSVTPSGLATKLTITEDMLAALKTGGLIISGVNFTLTSVDLLDASDVKVLTSTVSVTGDDWIWTSSETPEFKVNIENGNSEAVTAEAILMIKTDKLADVTTLTESKEIAANGSGTISFTYKPTTAGFYHATLIVNDETARAFYFGYAPTEIVSATDKQSDYDTFWSTAKTQLATVETSDEPVLTEITSKSTSKRKVYLVEFKSVPDGTSGDPVTVRGYYCEPTDGQKHPVIMHYLGYDSEYRPAGQDGAPYCPSGDANPDFAEFYLSTRGQSINNRKASERNDGVDKDFTNTYGDWFAYNFGNKDNYYYRGAYMDCVRAIDFMASRSTSDMDNLFAEGQSQGGAFTYAAAALSGRTFKAIAPAITFMGDFPDYFELTNWPANVAKANQGSMTDAEMYAFLSYFDTKNLAKSLSCPVITSIGVQDNVCPPHTNIAPYNNVTTAAADKQIIFNAELQHATNSEWNSVITAFFDKYNTWEDPNAKKLSVEEKRTLWTGNENLGTSWPAVATQTATVGGILEEGEKFLISVSAIEKDATDIQVSVRSADYEHSLGFTKFDDFSSYPAEVKLILSSSDVEAFKSGFHITGKNCTITKVVLYKPTPVNRTERTLLEKTQAIGDGIEINRGLFSNAVEEDVLKVYFEVADGVTAKINLEDMDYNGIENSWPVITTSPYSYTFTATALKKIQESGMRIRGENFTFLKATLYTEKELGTAINDGSGEEDDISNADASENTKKLYNVLKSLYREKIISGVVANVDWNTKEAENVYNWTGKWPAMNVYDFINIHASKDVNADGWLDYSDISSAKAWWKEGGIVGAMWHWQMKANNGTDYTCTPGTAAGETSFDASKILVEGTSENILAKQQLDQVCGYLAKMQDAGIPVVWRPLHEGSGNVEQYTGGTAWFWWGARGADVYKQLWQWMYNYMVKTKGLNNLIWVWTSQTKDNSWYPGDAYVDIIGRDNYGATAATLKSDYDNLADNYPNKMVTLAECGNSDNATMATISDIWNAGCRWSWFMTWYDSDYNAGTSATHKHADNVWWSDAMSKDYVVTRDQMKELLGQSSSDEPTQTGMNISLDDLNEGWNSEYDAATKTITLISDWGARGWYVGDNRYNDKGSVTVSFTAVDFPITLKMEYTNTGGEAKTSQVGVGAGETAVEIDIPSDIKTLDKLYITFEKAGKLVLTAVSINNKVNRTEKTLLEQSQAISDGDIKINRGLFSNAVAGDAVRIYASGLSDASKIALEPADYSGALDGANWPLFTESPFILKLTAKTLALIQEKGLLVRGEGYTFKKAVLFTENELGSIIPDDNDDPTPDPTPEPAPEPVFNEEGEADLSEVKPQDETTTVNYDANSGELTITTTEPYKAAQIWFNEPEEVAEEVLQVEIAEANADVIITVNYTDGTSSSVSSGVAGARRVAATRGSGASGGTVIMVPLAPGKEIQCIEIKNVNPGTITVTSMKMTTLISEGETVTLWSSTDGETLAWNDIARQGTDLVNLMKEYDEILITVSDRTVGNEWPKVFLRDANYEGVGRETLLNEVSSFPYVVRYVITSELLEKLKDGFTVCGDGVTVTKVDLYRPVPPKKGDISLRTLDYGYGSDYDAATNTITTTQRWAARGWEIGDSRYNDKDQVLVQFEAVDFPVTLKMEYVDGNGQKQATSAGVAGGKTEIRLDIPEGIKQMDKVYVIYQNPGNLRLTDAAVISLSHARTRGLSDNSQGVGRSDRDTQEDASSDDGWYTLDGQRVENPGKGIYIRNGKKIVVK